MTPTPSQTIRGNGRRSFSLVEIALALGIFAFAVMGILGLLAVAMNAAREGANETRVVHVARQILADLETFLPERALIAIGSNGVDGGSFLRRSLSHAWSETIFYDAEGHVLGTNKAPSAHFAVRVHVQPGMPVPGVAQIGVDVEFPVRAAPGMRARHSFETILRQ